MKRVFDLALFRDSFHKEDSVYSNSANFLTFICASILNKTPIYHRTQLTSFGGSGITMLMRFMNNYTSICGRSNQDSMRYKHMRIPPATPLNPNYVFTHSFKAIYIFGNPMNTVLSFFRRFSIQKCALNLSSEFMDETNPEWTLEEFLDACIEKGRDLLQLEEHFDNWAFCKRNGRNYPIMLVKYEMLWDNLSEIFRFLGIPQSHIPEFPVMKMRHSSLDSQPRQLQEKLNTIYGALREKIDKFNPIEII